MAILILISFSACSRVPAAQLHLPKESAILTRLSLQFVVKEEKPDISLQKTHSEK